jgi:hypothetical protein
MTVHQGRTDRQTDRQTHSALGQSGSEEEREFQVEQLPGDLPYIITGYFSRHCVVYKLTSSLVQTLRVNHCYTQDADGCNYCGGEGRQSDHHH